MSRRLLLGCASLLVFAMASATDVPAKERGAHQADKAASSTVASQTASRPASNYDVKAIRIDDVFASLRITVSERGPVTLALSGPKALLDKVHVDTSGDTLRIKEEHREHVWNWREWFDFKGKKKRDKITLDIKAPKGTSLVLDDFIGEMAIGDLEAPVKIQAIAATGTIGKTTRADVTLAGSGKLELGTVAQQLKIEIAGSGTVNAGSSGGAIVEIAGSGETRLGPVLGSLRVEIAGSGDVRVASVNGPTNIETAGAGSITIDTGEANPLKVEILGSGNVEFGGEAVNPSISALGSGNVSIRSYRGKLDTDGMAHVKIGGLYP